MSCAKYEWAVFSGNPLSELCGHSKAVISLCYFFYLTHCLLTSGSTCSHICLWHVVAHWFGRYNCSPGVFTSCHLLFSVCCSCRAFDVVYCAVACRKVRGCRSAAWTPELGISLSDVKIAGYYGFLCRSIVLPSLHVVVGLLQLLLMKR